MKVGNDQVGEGGRGPDEQVLVLTSAKKGKTSFKDDTLWLEFRTEEDKTFRSSYPFGRGGQGKLSSFLKAARTLLELDKTEDVDLDLLIDKPVIYERKERSFEGDDGKQVEYWWWVPKEFSDGEGAPPSAPKEEWSEKEQDLIEKLKSGLKKEEIYEAGKGAGMTDGQIDLFMMKASKTNVKQDGDKYVWEE